MAEYIFGPQVGPSNSKFRTVVEWAWEDQNNGKYIICYNVWIEVMNGNFYGTNIYCNWNNTTVAVYDRNGEGRYNQVNWYIVELPYGQTFHFGQGCEYTSGSGVKYNSTVSKDVTAPRPTYTVAYNANGGSGAPGNQTKTYGTNLTLSGTRPTRTGYTFLGWATSASDSVAYQPGGTYSANAAVTLYAKWQIITYTVAYNPNGGTGAPGNQTKTYGTNLTLSGTRPTRTGYTFLGWATSASGSVAYQPGGTYSSNAAVTLYARWQINTYTVAYNANGGSGAPASQTKTYGTNLTLSGTRPTRTGYTFLGWATSASGSVAYQPGGTYSANASVTLYAKWQIITYTVTYNANGGAGAPGNQTKTYGTNLTLSGTRPTRTGYTFLGWATSASGSVAYQPGGTYSANASVTLYAQWKKSSNCHIKVDGTYKQGMMHVRVDGVYKTGIVKIRSDGAYKGTEH